MKILQYILFLSMVLAVWTAMHLFVYSRLSRTLILGAKGRLVMKTVLVFLALSLVLGRVMASRFHSYLLLEISYLWLGLVSLLFFLLLVALPLNLLKPAWNQTVTWAAIGLTVLITAAGIYNYARGHVIERIKLTVPPSVALSGSLKVVHLSDLHMDRNFSRERIIRIVDDTMSQSPDLIVITGDILEGEIPSNHHILKEFSRLRAPLGVFAVSGNHEMYTGVRHVEKFLQQAGVTFLRNQRLDVGRGLSIFGFDDDEFRIVDKGMRKKQLALLDGLDPGRYNILLYHRPTGFEEHVQKGVHLQLSGHTHAGQTVPLNLIVFSIFRYPSGLYRLGESAIYTSRGTGVWGPPIRFPLPSELTVFEICPPPGEH